MNICDDQGQIGKAAEPERRLVALETAPKAGGRGPEQVSPGTCLHPRFPQRWAEADFSEEFAAGAGWTGKRT
jgi:hypothetical protein